MAETSNGRARPLILWTLAAILLVIVFFLVRRLTREELPLRVAQATIQDLITTDSTNGHFTAWSVQTGCNSLTGTSTDDPVLNAAQTVSSTIGSTAVSGAEYLTLLTALNMTGCSAGNNLVLAIARNNSGADTNTDTAVAAKWAELTFGRTINSTNR